MLESLDLLSTPADLLTGSPMLLLLDSIDEDPEQPRQEFDEERFQADCYRSLRTLSGPITYEELVLCGRLRTSSHANLACPEGLEPPTPSLEGWCSIQLSYGQLGRR